MIRTSKLNLASVLFLLLPLVGATQAYAQAPPLFHVAGEWIPQSDVDEPDALTQLVTPEDVEAQVTNFNVGLNVPIRLSERAVLMPGATYDLLAISQSGGRPGIPGERELHSVTASLIFNYRLSSSWGLIARFAPGLAGDFAEVDTDHLRLPASLLFTYDFSDRFTLGGGVLLTWQFGQPLPLPGVIVRWRPVDSLRVEAFLPGRASVVWQLHDRFEIGLGASLRGQAYTLSSKNIEDRWPCSAQESDNPNTSFDETTASPEQCFRELAYSRAEVGPTVSVRIASSLWLSLRASYLVFRRYEFLNEDGDTPDIGDLGLDPNLMLQARLEFRLPGS